MKFKAVLVAQFSLIAGYIIMLVTFLAAYISPIDTVIVKINSYGEAQIEFIFLLFTVPCVVYYLSQMRWKKGLLWVETDE